MTQRPAAEPAAISGPRPEPRPVRQRCARALPQQGIGLAAAPPPVPGQNQVRQRRSAMGLDVVRAASGAGTRVPVTVVYYRPSAARGILGAVVLSRPSWQAAAAAKTTTPRMPLGEPEEALANRSAAWG